MVKFVREGRSVSKVSIENLHSGDTTFILVQCSDNLHRDRHALTSELRVLDLVVHLVVPAVARVGDVGAAGFAFVDLSHWDDSRRVVKKIEEEEVVVRRSQFHCIFVFESRCVTARGQQDINAEILPLLRELSIEDLQPLTKLSNFVERLCAHRLKLLHKSSLVGAAEDPDGETFEPVREAVEQHEQGVEFGGFFVMVGERVDLRCLVKVRVAHVEVMELIAVFLVKL